jgi:hypothetical protein
MEKEIMKESSEDLYPNNMIDLIDTVFTGTAIIALVPIVIATKSERLERILNTLLPE